MAIAERALLVKLSISQWYNKTTDRRIADEVAEKYQVAEQEDRYVKTLLPRLAVRDIQRAIGELRSFHYANTLPWQDDSVRILSSANLFTYREGLLARRTVFDEAVNTFVLRYPDWVQRARQIKKGLFDEAQYPTAASLRSQYRVQATFLPFPDASDFRLAIDKDELERIKAQTQEAVTAALGAASQSLIERLYERVYLLYTALQTPDKVFRDSTVTSILETADLVERLNVANDMRVSLAVAATRTAMQDVTPDKLRAGADFRNKTAVAAAELLNALIAGAPK